MVYSTNIPNLISSIIDLIKDTGDITSITSSGTTRTIFTADTKNLNAGDYVTIGNSDFKILTLVANNKFTVVSTNAITATTWTAKAPYFFYGNPLMIVNTINRIKDYKQKYPIIVLFETMPSTVNDELVNPLERTVSLDMFVADEANYKDFSHEDYYSQVIDKLQDIADKLIYEFKNNASIGKLTNHKETPYSQWNLTTEEGKNVFDAELSAIRIQIDLPIKKSVCSL